MDNDNDNDAYVVATSSLKLSMPDSDLYKDARISPVSLTYYGLCLLEGNYSVKLHFAEIKITNDGYGSLGKRIFDIYIQVFIRSIHLFVYILDTYVGHRYINT